jgi:hypothetical protein
VSLGFSGGMMKNSEIFNAAFVSCVIYLTNNRVAKTLLDRGFEMNEIRKSLRKHFSVVMQHANVPVSFNFVQEIVDYVESELNELNAYGGGYES